MTNVELLVEVDRIEHSLAATAMQSKNAEAEMLVYRFAARMRQAIRGAAQIPQHDEEEEDNA